MSDVPSAEWEMVIIGFNRRLKQTDKPLNSAVKDAKRVAETAKHLGLCKDPLLVTDEEEEWGINSLREKFKVAAERLKRDNKKNLLVYYGGHGFRDWGVTIIVPKGLERADEAFVLQKMVVDTLAECNCESINVLVISAACGDTIDDKKEDVDESKGQRKSRRRVWMWRKRWRKWRRRGWMRRRRRVQRRREKDGVDEAEEETEEEEEEEEEEEFDHRYKKNIFDSLLFSEFQWLRPIMPGKEDLFVT